MLRIKDASGKVVGVLQDEDSEPEMKEEENLCCDCKHKCDKKKDDEECEEDCCQEEGE